MKSGIWPIEELIEDARAGRMFIMVDDETRENEGDLVIPAQFATPEAINFMARHARGLVCLALTRDRVEQLGLRPMSQLNGTSARTAFTVSIEARNGVTTGISAADRARTIAVAIDPNCGAIDIVSPGHVFPLEAREGGTLVRAGHTEAAVDLARLAGHCPAGVICEIMNDDGTMARVPDLVAFAQRHGLKLGTVADLISYRRRTERLVRRVAESTIEGVTGGSWKLVVYANTIEGVEHLALLKGPVSSARPAAVRMHTMDPVYDLLPDAAGSPLSASMRIVSKYGNGVVVLIRSASTTSLSDRLNAPLHGDALTSDLRDYGIGAQILVDLGVRDMIVLSNHPRTIVGLEGYGLNVVERWPIPEMPIA